MFEDTRPADLDAAGNSSNNGDPWSQFRVTHPQERECLLRALCDGAVPVGMNAPDGSALSATLWVVDGAQQRLSFSADPGTPQLQRLVDADEVIAVAYLQSVKLQFELTGFVLVRSLHSSALQCAMPREIYRFQRRNAYRVRPPERHTPQARLRHPSLPDMPLALRVLDVSIGGCALWLPGDVPPLQAGTRIGEMRIELDADTRFTAALLLQHVSAFGRDSRDSRGSGDSPGDSGVRLGCEWVDLGGSAERVLQRWIDRTQQRRRLLTLG